MVYLLNNHLGRYVIYLKFDTKVQLSIRLHDKGDDLVNFYFPIVSSGGFVDIDIIVDHHGLSPSLQNHILHRIVEY
jgi:hypothetical protein